MGESAVLAAKENIKAVLMEQNHFVQAKSKNHYSTVDIFPVPDLLWMVIKSEKWLISVVMM